MSEIDSATFSSVETEPTPAEKKRQTATSDYPAHGDKSIWGIYIFLCLVSIIELYSASSREISINGVFDPLVRHVMFLIMGTLIVVGFERLHYKSFFGLSYFIGGAAFLMMLYSLKFGDNINGAVRSFSIGPLSVQPSELIKFAIVLVVGRIMVFTQQRGDKNKEDKGILIASLIVAIVAAFLYPQGLTNTALVVGVALVMMLVGGVPVGKWLAVVAVFGILAYGGHKAIKYYHQHKAEAIEATGSVDRTGVRDSRMASYDPFRQKYNDPITATNRQEMYSYMAQANGGKFGVFPGNSRETARLPLAFSDYIFAIIVEEWGCFGGIVLMSTYFFLMIRALIIAKRCHRVYPLLLVTGMAVMIALQALFHMGIVSGAFPVSGQPLPLISKGGTSILVSCAAFGVMLSVSRTAVQNGSKKEDREELKNLPQELHPDNRTHS
ncbi:MAG: FtsW/RodA/SpoVE family cell cycle protein [Muribaculum sp.]|nr:FtsW/RodA/SpoVE family cell cycle protein [Muribaculum sp.]